MPFWVKRKLTNYVLKNLLNAVVAEDIIKQDKAKRIYVGGKLVEESRIKQWQAEIKAIEGSDIWKCTQSSLEYQAQDKIFARSVNFDDVVAGKMILYALSIINSTFGVVKNVQLK